MRNKMKALDDCIDAAAKIGSGRAPAAADNRRAHDRRPYHVDVPVVWLGPLRQSDRVQSVRASDVSVGGVRLLCRHMLYPGSTGVIQLARADGTLVLVAVEVLHTSYVGDMMYASGCRFIPVPEDQVVRFVRRGVVVPLTPGQPAPSCIPDLDAA
ncbi:MAG: PilZ domain-containing protein [Phycisphaerales bacterium]|nr:PilZ domain-containing protein [Phycisphaerales bacterium]